MRASVAPLLVLISGLVLATYARAQPSPDESDDLDAAEADAEAEAEARAPAEPPSGVPRTSCHGRRITAIEVEGARRVDPADVLAAMRLRRHATCTDEDVARDARTLWNLDFFDDLSIRADRTAEGVALTVVVSERPAIASIVFEGNDEVNDDDLDEEVTLHDGEILSVPSVREQLAKIRNKYAQEGFFLARVRYELRPVDNENNEVDVVFIIEEGIETVVRSIRFTGNQNVSSGDLRDQMETSETGLFSFISSGDTFNREMFENDITRIQAYYYDQGYLAVSLGQPRIELSPDRRYIDITIPVTEGPRFRIGRIEVTEVDGEGEPVEPLVPVEDLRSGVNVEGGDWFSRTRIAEGLESLTRRYRDEGYAQAELVPETEVDSERRIVDLNISINRGPIVYIERINIRGNSKTRDRVIRREIMLLEGMRYNQTLIERSKVNITALGYFERVDFSEAAGSMPGRIVLNVEVVERQTGSFQVGAGFSSLEQFLLQAQIDQQNLFGRGQSLSLNIQISGIRQLVQLQFVEPWFLGTMWSLGVDAFKTIRQYAAFSRDSTGGGLSLGHPIYDRRLRFNVGYRLEYVDIGASSRGFYGASQAQAFQAFRQSSLANRFLAGLTSSLRLGLTWDSRNNRMMPTNGFYASYSAEVADQALGSDNTFFRQNAFFRMYRRIWGPFVFRGNAEFGLITSRLAQGVPIYERYYLGGIYNVRGYTFNSLGPRAMICADVNPSCDVSSRGIPIGGNMQAYYQLEVEFTILQSAGIRGVIFTDGGNAWNLERAIGQAPSSSDPSYDVDVVSLRHIRTSVGFGFRWFSPMGPLRFEWGIPLDRRQGEKRVQFQFTIGNSF